MIENPLFMRPDWTWLSFQLLDKDQKKYEGLLQEILAKLCEPIMNSLWNDVEH